MPLDHFWCRANRYVSNAATTIPPQPIILAWMAMPQPNRTILAARRIDLAVRRVCHRMDRSMMSFVYLQLSPSMKIKEMEPKVLLTPNDKAGLFGVQGGGVHGQRRGKLSIEIQPTRVALQS